MNGRKLQDRLYLGMGVSARHIGHSANAFRASGPIDPLKKENRFLKMPATFTSAKGSIRNTNEYGDALWHGVLDASYTRTGDYLVSDNAIFFIASQEPLLPVLCVRTNRTISISRPTVQTHVAGNSYGGYSPGNSIVLMENWPASVLAETRSSSSGVNLPTDQPLPYWSVLLPSVAGILLSPGDVITDDLRRTAIVSGSEVTNLGWRLTAKMATT